jgi:hypothetical protein
MGVGPIEWLVILGSAVAVVALAIRAPRRQDIDLWARSYGLILTPANRPMVERYVRRATAYRRLGFLIGLVVVPPVLEAVGSEVGGWNLVFATAGYAMGITAAEVGFRRPVAERRAAGLEARAVDQYLPRTLIWVPRILTLTVVALGPWALSIDEAADGQPFQEYPGANSRDIVAAMVVAILVLVVTELLERSIVRRAQPADDPSVVAADDAIRAQSLHGLAGAVLAIDGLLVYAVLTRPAQANLANPWIDVVAVLSPLLGLLACVWFANRAWRVRRRSLESVAA